jgi:hypothetical protein
VPGEGVGFVFVAAGAVAELVDVGLLDAEARFSSLA